MTERRYQHIWIEQFQLAESIRIRHCLESAFYYAVAGSS